MGKIGVEKINTKRLMWYNLHRECVRRNLQYLQDYQELKGMQESKVFGLKSTVLKSHWGLWGNDTLPDPDQFPDLDQLKSSKATSDVYIPGDLSSDSAEGVAQYITPTLLNDLDRLKDVLPKLKGTLVLIDFPEEPGPPWSISVVNMKESKKYIHEALLEKADSILRRRRQRGLKQYRPDKRLRLEEGFEYLKIYDLRKAGKTFREIAEHMWPEQQGELGKKARLYFKKASAIIDNPPILERLKKQLEARRQLRRNNLS